MIRRALCFFLISTLTLFGVWAFHDFSLRDESILRASFISIGLCLLYVTAPAPFNHVFCFFVRTVPLWLLARFLHLVGAVSVFSTAAVIIVVLAAITFGLDYLAFQSFGAIGCIAATVILVTIWILFSRYLRQLITAISELLPKFVASTVKPLDQAIENGHKACDRFGDWICGKTQ